MQFSFGEIKSFIYINVCVCVFNCTGVSTHNPHIVQGSTVYQCVQQLYKIHMDFVNINYIGMLVFIQYESDDLKTRQRTQAVP